VTNSYVPPLEGDALKAVLHGGSHLQIIASASSGKTEVIAQRFAELMADGVDPAGIIAFTITERAVEELKTRIFARGEQRMGNPALDRLGAAERRNHTRPLIAGRVGCGWHKGTDEKHQPTRYRVKYHGAPVTGPTRSLESDHET
jgi:ATP-dependent exoDNAse (exonuclease V) beta subunit